MLGCSAATLPALALALPLHELLLLLLRPRVNHDEIEFLRLLLVQCGLLLLLLAPLLDAYAPNELERLIESAERRSLEQPLAVAALSASAARSLAAVTLSAAAARSAVNARSTAALSAAAAARSTMAVCSVTAALSAAVARASAAALSSCALTQ